MKTDEQKNTEKIMYDCKQQTIQAMLHNKITLYHYIISLDNIQQSKKMK